MIVYEPDWLTEMFDDAVAKFEKAGP